MVWSPLRLPAAVCTAALLLPVATGMAACGPSAADNATDTWEGVDVFFYDPDETPDIADLEDDAQGDGGDGGDGNPDGQGDGGDGGFDARFEGTVEIRVAGTATDTCTGTATVARVGPQAVEGTVACTFAGELASGDPVDGNLQGDAGGDGTMTVQLSADPFNTVLQGTFDDEGVRLTGSDSVGGEIAGNFAVTVEAARVE